MCPLVALVLLAQVPRARPAAPALDLFAPVEQEIAAAESSLHDGEIQVADSRYRGTLLEGWLLMGAIDAAEGRWPEAKRGFRRASNAAVETRRALEALALVHLQLKEAPEAVDILARVAGRHPKDLEARRLLVQARIAAGQPEQAVQELEEVRASAPDDLELAYMLATGYLKLQKPEAAERLFAQIAKAKPLPQTHILIGRAYRDADEYERARSEFRAALKQDPRVRRAHYYLGMTAVLQEGVNRLEEAIDEFERELRLGPGDPLASLRLGMALVVAQRPAEAVPHLEVAARSSPSADAFAYLGRARLALDRPAEAAVAFRRALELVDKGEGDDSHRGSLHYQLALALRKLGRTQEASGHFAEADRFSAQRTDTEREKLARYFAGGADVETVGGAPWSAGSPLARLTPAQRADLKRRATTALARAYLNLGVIHAQGERFARAADLLAQAAEADPEFPQVQYSLGVAYFNAGQFDKATSPLSRALEADPGNAALRRMLAMAWLNAEGYGKAAELLAGDPERERDPSLQYAYGLSLVRSGRAAEAQAVFASLLARHGESAELSVVLGQAHAQQGDYASAVAALTRALALQSDVAGANASLGVIYLQQGRLPEAEQALRAELKGHPGDVKSRHNLAAVLEMEGRAEEAVPLLRAVLRQRPESADARYLLGKILLAGGEAAEAVEHLEVAARISPEEPNIRFQLAQAQQKLGRPDKAQEQFEVYRQLKEKRRGSTP